MQRFLRREEKNLPDLEGNYEVVRNVSMAFFGTVAPTSGEAPAIFPRGRSWPLLAVLCRSSQRRVRVKSKANGWSARMQMAGQWQCK